jgi:hypothetical protein
MQCILLMLLLLAAPMAKAAGPGGDTLTRAPAKLSFLQAPPDASLKPLPAQPQPLVISSVGYGDNVQSGEIYSIDPEVPALMIPLAPFAPVTSSGDFAPGDPNTMYMIDMTGNILRTVDINSGLTLNTVSLGMPLTDGFWTVLAINKTTGSFYGVVTTGEQSNLYSIDPISGTISLIMDLGIPAVISGSFDDGNMLYLFDIDLDNIWVVNISPPVSRGASVLLGPAGFDGHFAQGMGYCPWMDEIFLAAYNNVADGGPELRLLNRETGLTTLVAELPGETTAFAFPFEGQIEDDFLMAGQDLYTIPTGSLLLGEDLPPIPEGFFNPGSDPFIGRIDFKGAGSDGGQLPQEDLTINRAGDIQLPAPLPSGGEVQIEIQQLNLVSTEPIAIGTFTGQSFWDVELHLVPSFPQQGNLSATKQNLNGGDFFMQLILMPELVFTEVGNPGNVRFFSPSEFGFTGLQLFSETPMPWTAPPIPHEFDPFFDTYYPLQTPAGSEIALVPLLKREDNAFLSMDQQGQPEAWEGTGINNSEWYYYPYTNWWNVWFYDHPLAVNRQKFVGGVFTIMPRDPSQPSYVEVILGWSTPQWPTWNGFPEDASPPLPDMLGDPVMEDMMIERTESMYTFEGNITEDVTVPIPADLINTTTGLFNFNPEWIFIDVRGYNFMIYGELDHTCFKPYIPTVPEGGILKVGKYLVSEDWNRWIGSDRSKTKVEYLPEVHEGILSVEFSYSIAGTGQWVIFDTDENGQSGVAPGPMPLSTEIDGWSGYLDHDLLPAQNADLDFRARVFTVDSFFDIFTELSVNWDVTPPSSVSTNLQDFIITNDPYILLEVMPIDANIAYIEVNKEPKDEYFEKGVPLAQQDPGSMDCGPVALAACLKYFEAHGHPDVCGNFDLAALIEFLKTYCRTNPNTGTWDTDLENGARQWLNNNGGGFSVRRIGFDWQTMRNELERGQDVITLFNWQNAQGQWGGHFMTFNSISNIPEPDGTIKIDFMDPASGEIIDGFLNLQTGKVTGFSDSNGNVIIPDGAKVTSSVIICPVEPTITPGTGTIIDGPFPMPITIPIEEPGMYWIRINIIDEDGNSSRLDYPIIALAPVVQPGDFVLLPDNKTNPEPWYSWITGPDGFTPVSLFLDDPDNQVDQVRFYQTQNPSSTDWQLFDTDDDGFAFSAPGPSQGYQGEADGWCGYLPHEMLIHQVMPIFFKAEVTTKNGDVFDVACERTLVYDPSPPSSYQLSVEDGFITDEDVLTIEIIPGLANLDYAVFSVAEKDEWYQKDVPFAAQQDTMSCGPYALAACLKYFANHGYAGIDGGLGVAALAEALKPYVKYDAAKGTRDIDLAKGVQKWIDEHGGGFTVTGPSPFSKFGTGNMTKGVEGDGLANGISQDIIPLFQWVVTDPTGQEETIGHFMTLSSVHNGLINGKQRYDFMDPGDDDPSYVEGDVDPATGECSNFTGGHPPDGTSIFSSIMICPLEPAPNNSSGGVISEGPVLPPVELPLPESGKTIVRSRAVDQDGNKDERDIVVTRVPHAKFPPGDIQVPLDSPPVKLQGGTPDGGTYAGPHVIDGWFYPIEEGVFLITYAFTYPNGFVTDVVFTITVVGYDFGDAPDGPYPTLLASNGARHMIDGLLFMGGMIDAEPDGQPSLLADGDDLHGSDDEDGVIFTTALIQGQVATIEVVASTWCKLNAWIDYNHINGWADVGEHIFIDASLVPGINSLSFTVPAGAVTGDTYARFRVNYNGGISYDDYGYEGEVEDYIRFIEDGETQGMDFGDAPDHVPGFNYHTRLLNNGARHIIDPDVFLGNLIDAEADGQPTMNAMGDDLNNLADEDGVRIRRAMSVGGIARISVKASIAGFLNAWVDFDQNGSWAEAGNQIFTDEPLVPGWNTLTFGVPADAKKGRTYARFRFNTYGGLTFEGLADDGEVEDYRVPIFPENWAYTVTDLSHVIAVPLSLSQLLVNGESFMLEPDDNIGAFYGIRAGSACGGAIVWDGTENQVLMAFGNDPLTNEKDGFDEGEDFGFKVYRPATGEEFDVEATFDPNMPNSDGKFHNNGISSFAGINLAALTQTLAIPQGWSGVSTYLEPLDNDIVNMFAPVMDNLVILYNQNGVYWPGQNINTMGQWDVYSGHVVKMGSDALLSVEGDELMDVSVALNASWNLVPVLSAVPFDVGMLFNPLSGFVAAKEVAGTGVYLPGYNINTIGNMMPGSAYYALTNQAGTVSFVTGSMKSTIEYSVPSEPVSPWNVVSHTPESHLVVFSLQDKPFMKGDIVGGFTSDGYCAGVAEISSNGTFALTLNRNDAFTDQKTGFDEGEILSYKVYRPATDETFALDVVYNPAMTSGTFTANGISEVTDVKASALGVGNVSASQISIYPNPSSGIFHIDGVPGEATIEVMDAYGQRILSGRLNDLKVIDLTGHARGVYFVKIQTPQATNTIHKIMVH